MTGSTTSMRTFARVLAFALCAALVAIPLGATPIATGSTGPDLFNGSANLQVVTNHGGEIGATAMTFLEPGAVSGNPATVVVSSTPYSMTLANSLAPGSVVNAATLTLDLSSLLTPGATSVASCVGTGCANVSVLDAVISPGAPSTVITVVSTSGTTYTWNYEVTSNPISLNLLTADPDFATDLANGEDLSVSWIQTISLSGTYNPPSGGTTKCRDCTMVFSIPLTGTTSANGIVDASLTGPEPPDPPSSVPEPSTGALLGLGIIATATALRRKVSPR